MILLLYSLQICKAFIFQKGIEQLAIPIGIDTFELLPAESIFDTSWSVNEFQSK
jgi:hypothetical protein